MLRVSPSELREEVRGSGVTDAEIDAQVYDPDDLAYMRWASRLMLKEAIANDVADRIREPARYQRWLDGVLGAQVIG